MNCSPCQLIELVAKVSYLDASVGWICNAKQTITGSTGWPPPYRRRSHLLAVAPGTRTDQMLVLIFPKSDVTVADNWDVMGLRATGSIDYHCSFPIPGRTTSSG